jgi:hypothetical protein
MGAGTEMARVFNQIQLNPNIRSGEEDTKNVWHE